MSKAKKIIGGYVKLIVGAQNASPNSKNTSQSAILGSAIGPKINLMEFCKAFDEKTKDIPFNAPVRVLVEYYKDRTFTFVIKNFSVAYLLKQAAGIEKGATMPGRDQPIGTVSIDQCLEIAKSKMTEIGTYEIEKALSTVIGSAKSMGIQIKS